jgi:holo-[acyl-carrier protein] synthase
MIIGIGTDIIDIRRIKNTFTKFGEKFKKRCFSLGEIKRSDDKIKSVNSYAKRYAAKEACAKALSTGLARGIFWKDIEIVNNAEGKPFIILHNRALSKLQNLSNKDCNIEVSLSDEKNYAIANVVIFEI